MRQKLPASPTPPPGCCRLHSQEQNPTHRRKWSTTSAIGRRHVAHPASHTATEPVKQASSPSKHRGSAGMCRRRRRRLNKTSRARASERARVRASELVCTSCAAAAAGRRPRISSCMSALPFPPQSHISRGHRSGSTARPCSRCHGSWPAPSNTASGWATRIPTPLISSLPGAILPLVSHKCGIELPKQRNMFRVNAGQKVACNRSDCNYSSIL